MSEPTNTIFIEDCTELNGTWVVSGLTYPNDVDEPDDMGLSAEFDSRAEAIKYAEHCAKGEDYPTVILLDGNEHSFAE